MEKTIDEKVMSLVAEESRDAVASAYIEGDEYVVELKDGWEAECLDVIDMKLCDTPNIIRVPITPPSNSGIGHTLKWQTKYVALTNITHCPYCGVTQYVRIRTGNNGKKSIGCLQCGVWFDYMFDTEDEAKTAWKARQPEAETSTYKECREYDKLRAEKGLPKIERCEDVNDYFSDFIITGELNDGVKEFVKTGNLPKKLDSNS